jgi:hypothetical protein
LATPAVEAVAVAAVMPVRFMLDYFEPYSYHQINLSVVVAFIAEASIIKKSG